MMADKMEKTFETIAKIMEDNTEPINVLIAGNGFDLHHYLPTRYQDFIDVVNRLIELETESKLEQCKFLIYMFGPKSPVYQKSQYIQSCYRIHHDTMQYTELDYGRLHRLVEISRDNIWVHYFLKICGENLGWIDFEKEIAKVVYAVMKYLDGIRNKDGDRVLKGLNVEQDGMTYEEYYIYEDFPQIFDTLYGQVKIKECYLRYREPGIPLKIDEAKVTEYMIGDLENLILALDIYIEEFVQKITANKKSENKLFEEIRRVINFNYTNTFSSLYSGSAPVFYIHGSSDKGNMVLGINDDEKDRKETIDLRFAKFKKYYQRVFKNTDYDYNAVLEKGMKYHLHFVGHSLDITDRDILTRLIQDEKVKISTIYYHDGSALQQEILNVIALFGKEEFDKLIYDKKIEFKKLAPFRA